MKYIEYKILSMFQKYDSLSAYDIALLFNDTEREDYYYKQLTELYDQQYIKAIVAVIELDEKNQINSQTKFEAINNLKKHLRYYQITLIWKIIIGISIIMTICVGLKSCHAPINQMVTKENISDNSMNNSHSFIE